MIRPLTATRLDLHSHTVHSDGLLTAEALRAEMVAAGLSLVAITDHDTLAGHEELAALGLDRESSPRILTGVEINSVAPHVPNLPESELHILGLGVDARDGRLDAALSAQRRARADRIAIIVQRLAAVGAPIYNHLRDLPHDRASAGRPQLARALVAAGHARDIPEAFDRYLGPDGLAYVPRIGMEVREAIDLILSAGGMPVLAHFGSGPDQPDVIRELRDWGLVGLEVYYSKFAPPLVEKLALLASAFDLIPTAGTDYHGDNGSYADTLVKIRTPEDLEDRVLACLDDLRVLV